MHITRSVESLPLRKWPPEAFEHESALGYFVRLAERNFAHSTRVFADAMGLNGRNFSLPEILAFCLEFPMREKEKLVSGTPLIRGNIVLLNGQRFRRRTDWSITRPRVCSACLGETSYYRNWWDLSVIDRCPIHDRLLVRGSDTAKLAWWYPAIGVTPSGQLLHDHRAERAARPQASLDSYVLGRLGVLSAETIPALDQAEMFEVIEAAELIGRAVESGWQKRIPNPPRPHGAERRAILCSGFEVLRGGEEALVRFAEAYLQGFPDARTALSFSWSIYFGWFGSALKWKRTNPILKRVRGVLESIAKQHGVLCRKASNKRVVRPKDAVTLYELAKILHVPPQKMREIATKLALIPKKSSRAIPHFFTPALIEGVQTAMRDLISRSDAAALTGLSVKEFGRACKAGLFVPFIRLRGPSLMCDKFRRNELLSHLNKLSGRPEDCSHRGIPIDRYCSLQKESLVAVIGKILDGRVSVIGFDSTRQGYMACILAMPTIREQVRCGFKARKRNHCIGILPLDVAILLGVNVNAVRAFVVAGCMKRADNARSTARTSLDAASVDKFHSKYAMAKDFAAELRCRPRRAWSILRNLGVKLHTVAVGDSVMNFVLRSDARRILGGVEESPPKRDDFWTHFDSHLKAKHSCSRLVCTSGLNRAVVRSGEKLNSMNIEFDAVAGRVQFEVSVSAKLSRRLFLGMLDELSVIRQDWAELVFDLNDQRDQITIRGNWHGNLNSDRYPEIFEWLDSNMTEMRGLLLWVRKQGAPKRRSHRKASARYANALVVAPA